MKENILISIGIPVYNESANIKKLLTSILSQIESGYQICEIIIIADGSTDNTLAEIKKIKNKKIRLIVGKKRMGKSARLNQIFKLFSGSILFLLDGDIEIVNKKLFTTIVKNTNLSKAGIVSINARPKNPDTFFQKVVYTGFEVVEHIAGIWNNGKNYLHYRGCFLVLDRKLAKQINISKDIVNNDAFLYIKAKEKGYRPVHVESAVVYFKSPNNFEDHLNQAKRFSNSKKELDKYFNSKLDTEYNIPKKIYISTSIHFFVKRHVYFTYYLLIELLILMKRKRFNSSMWRIATSTK